MSLRDEYKNFMDPAQVQEASETMRVQVEAMVHEQLNPNFQQVFIKYLLTHLVVGGLTLTVCPQYGVGPIGGGDGILAFVMSFGDIACAAFCGIFFFGISTLVLPLVLAPEELAAAAKSALGAAGILSAVSFALLMLSGFVVKGQFYGLNSTWTVTWFISGIFMIWVSLQIERRIFSV